MNEILEKLYWACESGRPQNELLTLATARFCEYKELLMKRLEGENLEMFCKFADEATEIAGIAERDNFVDGVKLGAKLILELT